MNSKQHIQDEELIGYIYRSIHDSERESIDHHLATCPICRVKLSRHQALQNQIDLDLKAQVRSVTPSTRMNFAEIEPGLHRRGLKFSFSGLTTAIPLTTTLAGLTLAGMGLWQAMRVFSLGQPFSLAGAYPALACFCLMFVSMDQFDRSHSLQPRFIIAAILAALLWLGTAVLGVLNILAARDIALILSVDAGRSPAEAGLMAMFAIFLATLVFIALVIGGAEYHYKRIGHPSSWKVFTWTLILQLLVMITPYFLW